MRPGHCLMFVCGVVIFGSQLGCTREDPQKDLEAARKEVESRAKELVSESERMAAEWTPVLKKAASDIQTELDKAVPSDSEWELIVEAPEEGADKLNAFAEKLAKLDRIKVGDLTVAYEQCEERSVAGVRYEKHFRARWVGADRVYCISCCSKKSVEVAAFLDLLQRLVPASNEVLKHVSVTRGNAK